jgi:hypothetical protein
VTALEFLCSLEGAKRISFRYDGSTSRWIMDLETVFGPQHVPCDARNDLEGADPESVARFELLCRAEPLRLGAAPLRATSASLRASSEQQARSARSHAHEASKLEAEADTMEAVSGQALLALILGVSEVEFAYQQETDLSGKPFGPPIWHARKGGDLGFSPAQSCRQMLSTATPEDLSRASLLYLHGQIQDAIRTETERIEGLRADLLRAEERLAIHTKNAQRISAFPDMRSVLKCISAFPGMRWVLK